VRGPRQPCGSVWLPCTNRDGSRRRHAPHCVFLPASRPRNAMTTARTVLVLGANGRFGLAAAQAFAAAGWRVLAQVRRDAAPGMPARAELVRAPLAALADGTALALLPRVAIVVHAVNPLYTRWEQEALPAAYAGMA